MTVFVSVGGSIISTKEGLNVEWIKYFAEEIKSAVKNGETFYIVVGGGKIAGQYVETAKKLGLENDFADSIAIDVTKINARLVGECLKNVENLEFDHGRKVGQTTDKVLIDVAVERKAKEVVNLTVIDGVYEKDPKEYPDAKLLHQLNASDYLKMFDYQRVHKPRVNAPFEYQAVKKAMENRIDIYVINGLNPKKEFHDFLSGRRDVGTKIVCI